MLPLPPIEKNPNLQGGYRFSNTDIGIGAVLAVNVGDSLAFIQKASKKDYEFSNLWALPGGMVRLDGPRPDIPTKNDICQFLSARVAKESGLQISPDVITSVNFGPVITSYTANGDARVTAVFVFAATLKVMVALRPNDPSIRAADWRRPLDVLPHCAPANRIIVAQQAKLSWNPDQIRQIRQSVEDAEEFCNDVARKVGFPPIENTLT